MLLLTTTAASVTTEKDVGRTDIAVTTNWLGKKIKSKQPLLPARNATSG